MHLLRRASALGLFALYIYLVLALLGIFVVPPAAKAAPPEVAAGYSARPLSTVLPAFERYAEKARQDWQVPGMAIAVVENDKLVYAKGFGVKTMGGNDPVDEHTLFQIGSTSKAFTAALVGMQVDEGKLSWTGKVVDQLPDFQMYDPWVTQEFTVEDTMAQRSGLVGYSGDLQSMLGFDRAHIMQSLRYIKPVSSFRSQYAYQNHLWLVAGALVEKASGKTWEENLSERILGPLGMDETSYTKAAFLSSRNVATMHAPEDGKPVSLGTDPMALDWLYTYGPAGGINSNVVDMSKWMRLQLGGGAFEGRQLVSQASMLQMHSPKTPLGLVQGSHAYYCQGWVYHEKQVHPVIWHTGGTSGFSTLVYLIPKAKVGIVVLSNVSDSNLHLALASQFYDMYFGIGGNDWSATMLEGARKGAQQGAVAPTRPASPALPDTFETYAGTYHSPVYGDMVIVAAQDGLDTTLGPVQMKGKLMPWDGDSFAAVAGSTDPTLSLVTFVRGADGTVTSLKLSALEEEGTEEFVKLPG